MAARERKVDARPHAKEDQARNGIAWAGFVVSLVALAFAVPAGILAWQDVQLRGAEQDLRAKAQAIIETSLASDDPERLAEAAAQAAPDSAAASFLSAVADAAYGNTVNGMLPVTEIATGCAAGSVACGTADAFAFDGDAVASFRISGRSVSRLIVTATEATPGANATVSLVSGFRLPTGSGATLTIEVANLTNAPLSIANYPRFYSGDAGASPELIGDSAPSTASCIGGQDIEPHSIATIVCDTTDASIGRLVVGFQQPDSDEVDITSIAIH